MWIGDVGVHGGAVGVERLLQVGGEVECAVESTRARTGFHVFGLLEGAEVGGGHLVWFEVGEFVRGFALRVAAAGGWEVAVGEWHFGGGVVDCDEFRGQV